MREPNLQRSAFVSAAFHLVVLLIVVLVARQSNRFIMPSPYMVDLVGPEVLQRVPAHQERGVSMIQQAIRDRANERTPAESKQDMIDRERDKDERIRAIAEKKKIERIVNLRKTISLSKHAGERGQNNASSAPAQGKGDIFDDYYRKITQEIWQQWVYPVTSKKDVEAVISIKILKDGTALVQKVEKSSGDVLFDKAALKALAKASPLTPPPYEMEVGVRFYP